jgi:hypothetical protein
MKGVARIRLGDGRLRVAELHWYEAHGIGKKTGQAQTVPRLGAGVPRLAVGSPFA